MASEQKEEIVESSEEVSPSEISKRCFKLFIKQFINLLFYW